jgi:hypothetical protein
LFSGAAVAQETLPWQTEEPQEMRPALRHRQADRTRVQSVDDRREYRGYQPPYGAGATQSAPYQQAPYQQSPYQQAQQTPAPNPYGPGSAPPTDQRSYNDGRGRGVGRDVYSPSRAAPGGSGDGTRYYPSTGQTSGNQPQNGPAPVYTPPRHVQPYRPPEQYPRQYGANDNYGRNPGYSDDRGDRGGYAQSGPNMPDGGRGTYSENEVVDAGHRFFGSLSTGLAKAIQWTFKQSGRPNGYILGEDAGGAFVAGLRYGEGKLYTKNFGVRRVFWQGPSIGYDFGGDGNRTMTLVYNLRSPEDVLRRFGGVQGAAYLVGGVSVQILAAGDVTLAPIRTGVGLRLGANIGNLKFTQRPTWNPF